MLLVGWLLTGDSAREQARWAWPHSRAAFFLAIADPVNIAARLLDHRPPAALVPAVAHLAGTLLAAAAIVVVFLLGLTGLLDELPAFAALVLAGTASCLAAGSVLFTRAAGAQSRPSRPAQAEAPCDRLTAVHCQPTEWSQTAIRLRVVEPRARCVLPTRWAGGSSARSA